MEISFKDRRSGLDRGQTSQCPRRDAHFTEIYELIFYSDILVTAELAELQKLIHRKLQARLNKEAAGNGGHAHAVYKRQAALGKI